MSSDQNNQSTCENCPPNNQQDDDGLNLPNCPYHPNNDQHPGSPTFSGRPCQFCVQRMLFQLRSISSKLASGPNPGDPSPPCPYDWMKPLAEEVITRGLIQNDVSYLYEKLSDRSKMFITFVDFGRMIATIIQNHGRFQKIRLINEPLLALKNKDFWMLTVECELENEKDFIVKIAFGPTKEIEHFMMFKMLKYHSPQYIKQDRFEEIEVSKENPYILYSKPTKVQSFPCALFIQPYVQVDIDMRFGFCFPAKDFEFLPSVDIGLIRTEYCESFAQGGNLAVPFASKLIETALSFDEITKIFLIMHSHTVFYMNDIVKKFPDIISGIILINPIINPPQNTALHAITEADIPKGIPILLVQGGYDTGSTDQEKKTWQGLMKKLGQESVLYDTCDHLLLSCSHPPLESETSVIEKHVSDVALRCIAQFIRSHSQS